MQLTEFEQETREGTTNVQRTLISGRQEKLGSISR